MFDTLGVTHDYSWGGQRNAFQLLETPEEEYNSA